MHASQPILGSRLASPLTAPAIAQALPLLMRGQNLLHRRLAGLRLGISLERILVREGTADRGKSGALALHVLP